jgi:hypothetical protein
MLALLVPGVGMGGGPAAAANPVRRLRLGSGRRVVIGLRGRQSVGFTLRAARRVGFVLKGNTRMSVTQNLTFFRGEDVTLDFTMTPPEDVTGWTITFKVADKLAGTVQFTKGATIVDGPRGKWRVSIASADTASLAVGRYVWDARRTDGGSKATLADGFLDLKQEVTA